MSTTADRLTQLQKELEALKAIQTQEDFDEGARLHVEKNAPWVNGMYSHLKFPAYQYREFPKMLYDEQYEAACLAYEHALRMPARGSDDTEREVALRQAQRAKDEHSVTVGSVAEQERLGRGWYESPTAAVAAVQARAREIEVAAAHLNYEDRNLTGAALEEREAADAVSDGHLVDVTATLQKHRGGRPKKSVSVGA
jgi:hypothetical protein